MAQNLIMVLMEAGHTQPAIKPNDINYVLEQCASYDIEKQFAYDRHISEYSKEIIEKLIAYLTNQGIEVELFFMPACSQFVG